MSMLFRRKVIMPVWVMAFGLFALLGPATVIAGTFLLAVGVVVPAIMLLLWKEPFPAVAEAPHHVDARRER